MGCSLLWVNRERSFTSSDGANWITRTPATNQVNLYAAAFGSNGFVAVGGTVQSGSTQPVVWTSPDGVEWTPQDVSSLNSFWGSWFQGVTYGAGLYVAVGGNFSTNTVATSPDGTVWTMRDSQLSNTGLTPLSCVAYGNGLFVAAGKWSTSSPDGITWTKQDSSTWDRLYAMTFADGRFLGVGSYSGVSSTNGTNWVRGTPTTGEYIYGVAYGDGLFVCLTSKPSYTTDGTNWVAQTNSTPARAIAYGNSVFVALGLGGTIYRTASSMHVSAQKDPVARLTLAALVPGTCRIDCSSNLSNPHGWSTRATIALTNSPATWTDWESTNVATRFYRALWTP